MIRVALKVDCDTYVGTREGVPRLLGDLRAAGHPRHVLLHLRARPLGSRRAADLHAARVPEEDAPQPGGLALRLPHGAVRDAAAVAADRRALRRDDARGRRGRARDRRPRLGPRRLARRPRPDEPGARSARSTGALTGRTTRSSGGRRARRPRRAGRSTTRSLTVEAERGLLYTSNTRGGAPFFPQAGGRALSTLEIPSTLPTLDETLAWPELSADADQRRFFREARGRHAGAHDPRRGGGALEGAALRVDPRRLARGRRAFPPALGTRAGGPRPARRRFPCARVVRTTLPGRGGTVATGWPSGGRPSGPGAAAPRGPRATRPEQGGGLKAEAEMPGRGIPGDLDAVRPGGHRDGEVPGVGDEDAGRPSVHARLPRGQVGSRKNDEAGPFRVDPGRRGGGAEALDGEARARRVSGGVPVRGARENDVGRRVAALRNAAASERPRANSDRTRGRPSAAPGSGSRARATPAAGPPR